MGCSAAKMVDTSFWKPLLQTDISEALSRGPASACRRAARHGNTDAGARGGILKGIETWAKGRGLSVKVEPGRLHIHPITGAQQRLRGVSLTRLLEITPSVKGGMREGGKEPLQLRPVKRAVTLITQTFPRCWGRTRRRPFIPTTITCFNLHR